MIANDEIRITNEASNDPNKEKIIADAFWTSSFVIRHSSLRYENSSTSVGMTKNTAQARRVLLFSAVAIPTQPA